MAERMGPDYRLVQISQAISEWREQSVRATRCVVFGARRPWSAGPPLNLAATAQAGRAPLTDRKCSDQADADQGQATRLGH